MPKKAQIDDTYAEAFSGIFCRVIVTADDMDTLCMAAESSTATPSVVIGRTEGGIERYLSEKETPDKRKGAILQFWGEINPKKTFAESLKKFETEMSYRIRQDILVKPSSSLKPDPCLKKVVAMKNLLLSIVVVCFGLAFVGCEPEHAAAPTEPAGDHQPCSRRGQP